VRKSIKKLDEKLQLAAQYPNLKTEISLIYGLPLQTVQSFEQSVSWVQRKLPSATIKAFPLMLLRGTALQRDAHRFGLKEGFVAHGVTERLQDHIPHVIESDSFSHDDWLRMAAIASAL